MAKYAFKDEQRKERIYAYDNNIMAYKSMRCYCKNPTCNAKMFIYMPENPSKAYFKSSGNPKHIGACGISSYQDYEKNNYDESGFTFPDNLMHLTKKGESKETNYGSNGDNNGNGNKTRPLSGLKETYAMLTNTDINDSYNGYIVKDMIADERTLSVYKDKIIGYKVVECNFYKYSDETMVIVMNYPTFPNRERNIELWFDEEELYEKIRERVKGKNHDGIIVVFGDWQFNEMDKRNYITITSDRQIAVIRRES